jgi:hypothetical protein
MLRGNQIAELLFRHDTPTYIAAQLREFNAFLKLDGIPSRGYQELQGYAPTPQVTDEMDREKGLWDLVFCSMQDLGRGFHTNGRTPNPYGPILLILEPNWLRGLSDVEIALLSGGNKKFDRSQHGLPPGRFEELFLEPESTKPEVASRLLLQSRFGEEVAVSNPEISAYLPEGKIAWSHVRRALVDPYTLGSTDLVEECRTLVKSHKLGFTVDARPIPDKRVFSELAQAVASGCTSSLELSRYRWQAPELQGWANSLHTSPWAYQADRWTDYLRTGTLQVMGD